MECHVNTEFQALATMIAQRTAMELARVRTGDYIVSLQDINTIKVASVMNKHIQNSNRSSEINLVLLENHATNRCVSPRHLIELLNAACAARIHGVSL